MSCQTKILLSLLLLTSLVNKTFAQHSDTSSISTSLLNSSMEELATHIERATGYKFFYDEREVDSVVINLNVRNSSLSQVLGKALSGTGLFFTIDHRRNIFITRMREISLVPGAASRTAV